MSSGRRQQISDDPDLVAGFTGVLVRKAAASGELILPPLWSRADHYVDAITGQLTALGRAPEPHRVEELRAALFAKIGEAKQRASAPDILVKWSVDTGAYAADISIEFLERSLELDYERLIADRSPPLFGGRADAKVLDLARSLGTPTTVRCLDIGAGTGRNALDLARAGHPVDALELTEVLARVLEHEALAEKLRINVSCADALADVSPFEAGSYRFVFASEVTPHFGHPDQLRRLLQRMSEALAPGGIALINAFVAKEGYQASPLERELAPLLWSGFFTWEEIALSVADLPLASVSDEAVTAYEWAHLPRSEYPPTRWFEAWANGADLYGRGASAPIELRWLAWRRR